MVAVKRGMDLRQTPYIKNKKFPDTTTPYIYIYIIKSFSFFSKVQLSTARSFIQIERRRREKKKLVKMVKLPKRHGEAPKDDDVLFYICIYRFFSFFLGGGISFL